MTLKVTYIKQDISLDAYDYTHFSKITQPVPRITYQEIFNSITSAYFQYGIKCEHREWLFLFKFLIL